MSRKASWDRVFLGVLGALAFLALCFWIGWMINYQVLQLLLTGLDVSYDPEKLWRSALAVTIWTAGLGTAASTRVVSR